MGWRIEGTMLDGGRSVVEYVSPEEARVQRREQLAGDPGLVALLLDDADAGRIVHATPTSGDVLVSMDDSASVFLACVSRLRPGYTVEGDDPGVEPEHVPPGAVA
jgi:hypothetical protein